DGAGWRGRPLPAGAGRLDRHDPSVVMDPSPCAHGGAQERRACQEGIRVALVGEVIGPDDCLREARRQGPRLPPRQDLGLETDLALEPRLLAEAGELLGVLGYYEAAPEPHAQVGRKILLEAPPESAGLDVEGKGRTDARQPLGAPVRLAHDLDVEAAGIRARRLPVDGATLDQQGVDALPGEVVGECRAEEPTSDHHDVGLVDRAPKPGSERLRSVARPVDHVTISRARPTSPGGAWADQAHSGTPCRSGRPPAP